MRTLNLIFMVMVVALAGCRRQDGSKVNGLNCQGGLPGRLSLNGAINEADDQLDSRLKIDQVIGQPSKFDSALMRIEKSVEFAAPRAEKQLNNILINFNCPEDLVRKYQGSLDVMSFEDVRQASVADTILLCGRYEDTISLKANRVVMAGFDLLSASVSPISLITDKLILEMDSRLMTIGLPTKSVGFAAGDIQVTVNQSIEGSASLEVFSRGLNCGSLEASQVKTRLQELKAVSRPAPVRSLEPGHASAGGSSSR